MPDWSSNVWVVTILGGVAVLVISGLLKFFGKGIWSGIVHLWTKTRPRARTQQSAASLNLFFVELHSLFSARQQHYGQWTAQIITQWDVTNLSKSGMSAFLLRAHLVKPRWRLRPQFEEARGQIVLHRDLRERRDSIPANTKGRISIQFRVVLPGKPSKSITLKIVVVDQFNNEHALPVIRVKPQVL